MRRQGGPRVRSAKPGELGPVDEKATESLYLGLLREIESGALGRAEPFVRRLLAIYAAGRLEAGEPLNPKIAAFVASEIRLHHRPKPGRGRPVESDAERVEGWLPMAVAVQSALREGARLEDALAAAGERLHASPETVRRAWRWARARYG